MADSKEPNEIVFEIVTTYGTFRVLGHVLTTDSENHLLVKTKRYGAFNEAVAVFPEWEYAFRVDGKV